MKAVDIELKQSQHVKTLVNIANRYPFPILLRQGRYLVDAKSLLGICSLHKASPIQIEIYSDEYSELMDDLEPLMC